ncbi:MAG TPA: hypothetical protein VL988_01535 [Solirubrobacteraceae bacterium]|nr:hypothetical protein [Solirubrobacteraceae bacterium]
MLERNPYLILGVDFAASGEDARRAFAHAARRLRREGGVWEIEDLNWALHEIQALDESPADTVTIYRVPANGEVFVSGGTGVFRPAPIPLRRRTPAHDEDSLREVRRNSLRELDRLVLEDLERMQMPVNGYELEDAAWATEDGSKT